MKKIKIKRIFTLLLSSMILFPFFSVPISAVAQEPVKEESQTKELKFNKDGKFKILVLADIQDTNMPQKETMELVNAAIDKTNPDFIALAGDNIAGWWKGVDKDQTKQAIDAFSKAIDDRGIPFALVFGNHDHEGLCDEENRMSEEDAKELMLSWYQAYDTCMAIEGEDMTGVGNYNLTIKDSTGTKDVYNLWFMDSNPYTPEEEGGGYGYVHEDQTAWYQKTSNELKEKNGGEPLPSMLFQHIAVPEVYDMFNVVSPFTKGAVRGHGKYSDKYYVPNTDYVYEGLLNEGPCPPDVNHGQFDSWVEQGDVVAAIFGHDHSNSYGGKYKGIYMLAAPGCTYYSYGNNHGVRTITLLEDDLTTFKSDLYTYKDLVGHEVSNSFVRTHGYYEYKHKFIPLVCGGVALVAVAGVAIGFGIKYGKKRKNKGK